jgi:hypothetical protein
MGKGETYVSTDIESDGPIRGVNWMLSFASVALDGDGRELATFSANLEPLPGASPFSHSGIDIKTMAWTAMPGRGYREATKRNMPRHWRPARRHSHVALDDAREQGELFVNIRHDLQRAHS